ncbi:uncharacterized protein PF3D7_1120000-like [Mytilus edulis]|uniref:uncharacterized protein PF3D7_1120000-like n=1 Tax=Mytilus edulis TaxID=6550 RepID=UPI0039EE28EB
MITNENTTDMEGSSMPNNTTDPENLQDESLDEDEMTTIQEDMTSVEEASKQINLCMEIVMKAKKEFAEKDKERDEQTLVTLEYLKHLDDRVEKLRNCSQRTIPYIRRYNKSMKKIKQEINQKHKEQINKIREENWDKYKETIKNAEVDIHNQYQPEIERIRANNTELTNRCQTEIKKITTENWNKYKEDVDRIQQQLTERFNLNMEKLNAENERLREQLKEIHTIVIPKIEKDCQQSVLQVEEKIRQDYLKHVREMKNKSDVTIQELKSENLTLRTFGNRQNVEMETFISTIKELERSNQKLVEKNIKLDELEKKRIQQMLNEFENLRKSLVELRKENEMLNATVEEKVSENLQLDNTIKELITKINDKDRITVHKSVKTLQIKNCQLRKELLDKHLLIDQAQRTLSRSRSLCDLSHSGEEIKIRTEMLQCSVKEADEDAQQIFDDQAETLYECTGKRQSLQSLTQNLENNVRFQKEETEKYDPDQGLTEREM